MLGYILVEPDLRIERVPDLLVAWEDILWPAGRNVMPAVRPGSPAPVFSPKELYHRHTLGHAGAAVYVWTRRDANALPDGVTAAIRERAAKERESI